MSCRPVILVALLTMLVMMSSYKCEEEESIDQHEQHIVDSSHPYVSTSSSSSSSLNRLLKKRSNEASAFQADSGSLAPSSKSSLYGKKRYNYRKRIQLPFKWGKRSQQQIETAASDRVQEVCESYGIILAKQRDGEGVVRFLSQLSREELEWLTVKCDGRLNNNNNMPNEEDDDDNHDSRNDDNSDDGHDSLEDSSDESDDADGVTKRKRGGEKVIQLKRYNNIPFRWGK